MLEETVPDGARSRVFTMIAQKSALVRGNVSGAVWLTRRRSIVLLALLRRTATSIPNTCRAVSATTRYARVK